MYVFAETLYVICDYLPLPPAAPFLSRQKWGKERPKGRGVSIPLSPLESLLPNRPKGGASRPLPLETFPWEVGLLPVLLGSEIKVSSKNLPLWGRWRAKRDGRGAVCRSDTGNVSANTDCGIPLPPPLRGGPPSPRGKVWIQTFIGALLRD